MVVLWFLDVWYLIIVFYNGIGRGGRGRVGGVVVVGSWRRSVTETTGVGVDARGGRW